MKVSQAAEIYTAIQAIAKDDDSFRHELITLFEGVTENEISDAKSQRIIDFLSEDERIPFDKSQENELAWITIPITISIALCPGPAY